VLLILLANSTHSCSDVAEVDEKLYSRQLYVMGHEAQRRMMNSRVLLVGLGGLGMEIAKNVVLAGISSLILCDPTPPSFLDLSSNFYLQPKHMGDAAGRASLVRPALAELNPYVTVRVAETPDLAAEAICAILKDQPTVVVITIPLSLDIVTQVNEACRQAGICFIYAATVSVFGQVFCDFGPAFVVSDVDDNPPATSQIESIIVEPGSNPVVKVLEDQGRHELNTDDCVQFSRLVGTPPELLPNTPYTVKVTGPYTFELQNVQLTSSTASDGVIQTQQGYVTQIKQPATIAHESFATALVQTSQDPDKIMLSDFAKMGARPHLLHLLFYALQLFLSKHGALPRPLDTADYETMLATVQELDTKYSNQKLFHPDNADELVNIIRHFCHGASTSLSPMCAALGGLVGQEVLKACSAKFTPVAGFFYLDSTECLCDYALVQASPALFTPQQSRHDSQIIVFGQDMQDKIFNLRYFMVGAGAIGCEMLKNWALIGVGENGHVHITDMDRIEKSNLSRQFLFRNSDINQFKSTTAAKAAQTMNPAMKVTAYQEKVAPDTEHLFGDDFYDKLSGVCTALDNIDARLYVDQRCLFYRLPMLESGTLGTKGNTQIVVPGITENYGATRDPPEKSIPVCTLKNFPNQIQHTIQWARDYFEGAFKKTADEVNSYLSLSQDQYLATLQPNTKLESLQILRKALVSDRPRTFDDCISWSRRTFEKLFNNDIRQLLYNFPEDQVTSSGTKFWSGSKRCPKPVVFDLDNEPVDKESNMRNGYTFVMTGANLYASMYGITGSTDESVFKEVLANVIVPDFTPTDGVKIAANDAEAEAQNESAAMDTSDDAEVNEIWNSLPKPSELVGFRLSGIDFDKDIDEHATFITACSNLRATNYSIPTADVHQSRSIAGRIIPAIATTIALVTGIICLELYKLVGTPRKDLTIEAYKNGFINLAVPFMTLSEPTAPGKTKALLKGKEWDWTAWDSLDMNVGNITMGEFIDYFENEYNLDINMLSHGSAILFSFFANAAKVKERKAMKMTDVITSITNKEFPPNQLFIILEVIANDKETDEEVELPYIKFRFR
jgi:ubiquitin-activating enzyme E1